MLCWSALPGEEDVSSERELLGVGVCCLGRGSYRVQRQGTKICNIL